jgi:hypothetical protein
VVQPHAELIRVTESLGTVERRLRHCADELSVAARRLRAAGHRPTFIGPAGDRSRAFIDAQANRLDRLADRQRSLAHSLRQLAGSLRPKPAPAGAVHVLIGAPPAAELDWDSVHGHLQAIIRDSPPIERPLWDDVSDSGEHAIGEWDRPQARGAVSRTLWWQSTELRPVTRQASRVLLDLDEIKQMTSAIRAVASKVAELGSECYRELQAADAPVPPQLHAAMARTGLASIRACKDVAERLERHAAHVRRRLATPGLLGPGPEYGLAAFAMPAEQIHLPPEMATMILRLDTRSWLDAARELEAVMTWLCRRLPIVFGTPADDFLNRVGITDTSPPPDRPPANLPPVRYPVPPGPVTMDLIVDPATQIEMSRSEYYSRYGFWPGDRASAPITPVPISDPVPAGADVGSGSTAAADGGDVIADLNGVPAAAAAATVAGAPKPASTDTSSRSDDEETLATDAPPEAGPGADAPPAFAADAAADTVADSAADTTTDSDQHLGTDAESAGVSAGEYGGGGYGGSSGAAELPADTFSDTTPSDDVALTTEPAVAAELDSQVRHDVAAAVRHGGVRMTAGAGAAFGSVLVGGGAGTAAVLKRSAAKKVTSWARYKAVRRPAQDKEPSA